MPDRRSRRKREKKTDKERQEKGKKTIILCFQAKTVKKKGRERRMGSWR
jgi:hypothetical protein